MKKRSFVMGGAALVMLLLALSTSVSATVCYNASKPDGAGNFVNVTVRLDGTFLIESSNPAEQLAGGFFDLFVEFDLAPADGIADGAVQIGNDLFALSARHALAVGLPPPELPEGAHLAAGCGIGPDDLMTCGP